MVILVESQRNRETARLWCANAVTEGIARWAVILARRPTSLDDSFTRAIFPKLKIDHDDGRSSEL